MAVGDKKMNPYILALFLLMLIAEPMGAFGILTGLAFCYLITDKKGKDNMVYKITHWGWTFKD